MYACKRNHTSRSLYCFSAAKKAAKQMRIIHMATHSQPGRGTSNFSTKRKKKFEKRRRGSRGNTQTPEGRHGKDGETLENYLKMKGRKGKKHERDSWRTSHFHSATVRNLKEQKKSRSTATRCRRIPKKKKKHQALLRAQPMMLEQTMGDRIKKNSSRIERFSYSESDLLR
jgi:hypothetical protein